MSTGELLVVQQVQPTSDEVDAAIAEVRAAIVEVRALRRSWARGAGGGVGHRG